MRLLAEQCKNQSLTTELGAVYGLLRACMYPGDDEEDGGGLLTIGLDRVHELAGSTPDEQEWVKESEDLCERVKDVLEAKKAQGEPSVGPLRLQRTVRRSMELEAALREVYDVGLVDRLGTDRLSPASINRIKSLLGVP